MLINKQTNDNKRNNNNLHRSTSSFEESRLIVIVISHSSNTHNAQNRRRLEVVILKVDLDSDKYTQLRTTSTMSRKPPTSTNARTGPSGSLVRAPSSSNLNKADMPPPSRIPGRPASAMSASTATTRGAGDEGSRANSPTRKRVVSGDKKVGKVGVQEKVGEDGEMNIQVVVRCR